MGRDGSYTHGHHPSVLASHGWRTAENSAGYLLPHLSEGADLLDVGCGVGTITVGLAQRVNPGRVVGLDPAGEALMKASELADASGAENMLFEQGDVHSLPYAEGAFDVVHAHQLLQHLSDPVAALVEMARVTRRGGLIAVRDADYAAMTWYPASPGLERWRELYRTVIARSGGQADAGRRLLAWAHEAGFEDVTATAGVWCYADPDDRAWWSDTWATRVTQSGLAEHAVEEGLATSSDLAELAEAWQEWGTQDDGWFVVVHGEILIRL
ncbi:MAG TPA: methyltransferase domain-containing protein [Candidatus Ruania gallistercoris]|uniref:Methyltransferase domain-containing protein n=1 Tax=Candidatus Ruania gallistercoris TaxID=2838746 RepID=A0A9D2J3X0_9MICO|nr:methyltransferase domain-containing protein [Candidatus Ruania gallistercoris]